jgi:hypothetical protein
MNLQRVWSGDGDFQKEPRKQGARFNPSCLFLGQRRTSATSKVVGGLVFNWLAVIAVTDKGLLLKIVIFGALRTQHWLYLPGQE